MPAAYLENLQNAVAALGRPAASALVAGIADADVRRMLGEQTPREVVEWFGWCNGVTSGSGARNDDVAIIPGYSPVSLMEALSIRELYEGDSILWPEWIPLLVGPSGDMYAAVWPDSQSAQVAGVLIGEPTEIEFSSIAKMVSCFISCIDRGAFFVNSQGLWSIEPDLYDLVYAEVASGTDPGNQP